MSPSTTAWPKGDQCEVVSTTERPVTQVAEVAVNRASNGWVKPPEAEARGRASRAVPRAMSSKKLITMSRMGAVRFIFWESFCFRVRERGIKTLAFKESRRRPGRGPERNRGFFMFC